MIAHTPPYILEFRAVSAVMASGNARSTKFLRLLDTMSAFLFEGEKNDFAADPICAALVSAYPSAFLKNTVSDMMFRCDLTEKLIASGKLKKARQIIAESSIRILSIAARENLTCVFEGGSSFWDPMDACSAASLMVIPAKDFITVL